MLIMVLLPVSLFSTKKANRFEIVPEDPRTLEENALIYTHRITTEH